MFVARFSSCIEHREKFLSTRFNGLSCVRGRLGGCSFSRNACTERAGRNRFRSAGTRVDAMLVGVL